MVQERIKCAALRNNGKIYIGRYHGEIFPQESMGVLRHAEQGFVTHEGRFVGREEALVIAQNADQIVKKHNPFDLLLAEDFESEF